MKTIKLPYTPSITKECIMDILHGEFPEKKVSKFLNQVRIKQNALRVASIVVMHNQKKNSTHICISATTPVWVSGTIIIPILFIILTSYSLCGNWATEITAMLNNQLQNPRKKEKSQETEMTETQSPETKRTTTSTKISFAKFGNIAEDL